MSAHDPYRPRVSAEEEQRIRSWHEAAYTSMRSAAGDTVSYLGREFFVPEHVFPPAPMSRLLGEAVLAEVRDTDRVLDMGTGSGVNAILAASRATDIVGVDVNPYAVAAAVDNAVRNDVADRITFVESDVFDAVDGRFDLIVFDPPFRWFVPRDHLEASMADENYQALTRFIAQARDHLTSGGRVLVFFGSSGDLDYLRELVERNGFTSVTLSTKELVRDEMTVSYHVFRLST